MNDRFIAQDCNIKIVLRLAVPSEVAARLQAAWPEARFVTCAGDVGLLEQLGDADILLGGTNLTIEMVRAAPRLRWVQALGVGVNGFLDPIIRERGIIVTNARGVNLSNLAEHAVALMLSMARGIPELARRQTRHEWLGPDRRPTLFELDGQRLGLLGYGELGRGVARRVKAFGMDVWAMRRRPGASDETEIDRVLPPAALDELVAGVDHLMVALPLTPETQHIVDTRLLGLMKPTAYLYNMGRGGNVDHDALVAALANRTLAGAALDVTEPEPLNTTSPLWDMPNVLITAHTGGLTPRFFGRTVEFLEENLRAARSCMPLRNIVDTAAGY